MIAAHHIHLSCVLWGFELQSSHLYSKHFSPPPMASIRWPGFKATVGLGYRSHTHLELDNRYTASLCSCPAKSGHPTLLVIHEQQWLSMV